MDSAGQARLHYEMGICADAQRLADEAWDHFCRANRLAEAAAPPKVLAAGASLHEIEVLAKQFSPKWVESFTEPISHSRAHGPDPVFLVGFPRSGTTLLDQILDSHPLVTTMEGRPFSAELVKLAGGHRARLSPGPGRAERRTDQPGPRVVLASGESEL